MYSVEIKSFFLTASTSHDICALQFSLADGKTTTVSDISPARFAAIVATLQATPRAYLHFDNASNIQYVTSSEDVAG